MLGTTSHVSTLCNCMWPNLRGITPLYLHTGSDQISNIGGWNDLRMRLLQAHFWGRDWLVPVCYCNTKRRRDGCGVRHTASYVSNWVWLPWQQGQATEWGDVHDMYVITYVLYICWVFMHILVGPPEPGNNPILRFLLSHHIHTVEHVCNIVCFMLDYFLWRLTTLINLVFIGLMHHAYHWMDSLKHIFLVDANMFVFA